MKNIFKIKFLILSVGMLLFSCTENSETGEVFDTISTSKVIVINAMPETTAINYKLLVNGLTYGNITSRQSFPYKSYSKANASDIIGMYNGFAPSSTLALTSVQDATKPQTVFVTLGNSFSQDKNYTVVAANFPLSPEGVVYEDDLTLPASGKAKIRLLNLVPNNTTMYDLYSGTTLIKANIAFKATSEFIEVTPGQQTLAIRKPGTLTNFRTRSINLQVGKIYTFFVTGSETVSSTSSITVAINYMLNKN